MSKNKEEMENVDPVKWFGMILLFIPSLLLKSGVSFLRFKRQAKRGGLVFRKELIHQGLDKKTAAELTAIYLEGSDILKYMQHLR